MSKFRSFYFFLFIINFDLSQSGYITNMYKEKKIMFILLVQPKNKNV